MDSTDLDELLCDLERSCDSKRVTSSSERYVGTTLKTVSSRIVTTNSRSFTTRLEDAYAEPIGSDYRRLPLYTTEEKHGNIEDLESLLDDLSSQRSFTKKSATSSETRFRDTEELYRNQSASPTFKPRQPNGVRDKQHQKVIREMSEIKSQYRIRNGLGGSLMERGGIDGAPMEYKGHGLWKSDEFSKSLSSKPTDELDKLMTTLNYMKLKVSGDDSGPTTSPMISSGAKEEESVHEKFTKDVTKLKPSPHVVCFACKKGITGSCVTAHGKSYHPEHLCCSHCNQELRPGGFEVMDEQIYCVEHYYQLFAACCESCGEAIMGNSVEAMGRHWHPEHFVCTICRAGFDDDEYHEHKNLPYCSPCYAERFSPSCSACSMPIIDLAIDVLGAQWHQDCFVCVECAVPFYDTKFYEFGGRPYCELHYRQFNGQTCYACGNYISGRSITALSKKFHPEHFVCSFCHRQLEVGFFKETGMKPYCHECFDKLHS